MRDIKVGIGDIGIYIPQSMIPIERLTLQRPDLSPKTRRGIERAARVTGQKAIRFPYPWEDTATLAAQSAKECLDRQDHLENIRYLAVGTETTVDHSKPVAAYVQGMLKKAGYSIPSGLSTFQVQHACAGGTLALLSVCALLGMSPRESEKGLVICSDIARYEAETTAEVTQGSGAVSLMVEKDPPLLELDIKTQGYYAEDVDDFFRPLGSITAKVKGRYSINCFEQALVGAFQDHCSRRNKSLKEVLEETDYFVLHTPFKTMPITAMEHLLKNTLGLENEEAKEFMERKGVMASVEPSASIGNLYSGALFLSLAALLKEIFMKQGDQIVGKNIILASYGSGNIMIVLNAVIAPGAPEIIAQWDFGSTLNHCIESSIDSYKSWITRSEPAPGSSPVREDSPVKGFYLKTVREDGYREYEYKS